MPSSIRVLIVEDSLDDTWLMVRELQRGGFHVEFERVETSAAMQAALELHSWDIVLSDYRLPLFSGNSALTLFQQKGLDIPFIIVSGAIGEDRAVEILKMGAHDYVMKDNLLRLVPAVTRELQAANERRMRRQAEARAAYLASLVESCEDAIIGTTLDGIVVSWNSGAERLYGYAADEILGRSTAMLFPRYRPQELPEILERIKKGERMEHLETVRIRKDGSPVEVSLGISPVRDSNGSVIGVSTVAYDITRRKELENERLALIQELTNALAHPRNQHPVQVG
jgi:PAS domain S-box-containing protein